MVDIMELSYMMKIRFPDNETDSHIKDNGLTFLSLEPQSKKEPIHSQHALDTTTLSQHLSNIANNLHMPNTPNN